MYLLTKWEGRMGNTWLNVMAYGLSGARSVRHDRQPNIFHPARPNLVSKYFIIWPIWRQICLNFLHARPYVSVVGPYGFFRPRSRKCVRPSYRIFINGFAKKALAGPYGSYDKNPCCIAEIPKGARSHWLLRGHMTSNNKNVSRQKSLRGQHYKINDVRE